MVQANPFQARGNDASAEPAKTNCVSCARSAIEPRATKPKTRFSGPTAAIGTNESSAPRPQNLASRSRKTSGTKRTTSNATIAKPKMLRHNAAAQPDEQAKPIPHGTG